MGGDREYKLIFPKEYFEKIGGLNVMEVDQEDSNNLSVGVIMSGVLPSSITARPRVEKKDDQRDDKLRSRLQLFGLPPPIGTCLGDLNAALRPFTI